MKYYFALDFYKYARPIPVYLAQMQEVKATDPKTWGGLKNGDFMVSKSGIPFTNLFVDQALEQHIRELKIAGGVTGITQNEDALNRFFLIALELRSLIQQFEDSYFISGERETSKECYQLSGSVAVRIFNNFAIIKQGIIKHCDGNPFLCKDSKLMNLVSNVLVQDNAKDDIFLRDEKGTNRFKSFVAERLTCFLCKNVGMGPHEKNENDDI